MSYEAISETLDIEHQFIQYERPGDHEHCRVSVTHSEETKSAISRAHTGMKKTWAYKPITLEKDGEIRSFPSQKHACEELNLRTSHVSEMVNGIRRKSVKGWHVV